MPMEPGIIVAEKFYDRNVRFEIYRTNVREGCSQDRKKKKKKEKKEIHTSEKE